MWLLVYKEGSLVKSVFMYFTYKHQNELKKQFNKEADKLIRELNCDAVYLSNESCLTEDNKPIYSYFWQTKNHGKVQLG